MADNIGKLENDSNQAQRQLDGLSLEAGKVGLEINAHRTEQKSLNQLYIFSPNGPLVIKAKLSI